MRIRIGVVDSDRIVEVDSEDVELFRKELSKSYQDGVALLWFVDFKGRRYAIPRDKLAFVEIEAEGTDRSVGFAAGA